MSTLVPPAPASIFTREYIRSLTRAFRRICPTMGVVEAVRATVEWQTHPLDARLNAAFAAVFLLAAVALRWGRRPLLVIRVGFLGAVLVALSFDLFAYVLLPAELTPQNLAYVRTGHYMYLTYVMMLLCWLLFPVPWAGRLALSIWLVSLSLSLLSSGPALAQGQVTANGVISFFLHQAVVGGSFHVLLQVLMAVYTRQAHLEREQAHLQQAALQDPLTGLANRRALNGELVQQVTRSQASGQPLSLVILDLDHFKQVNDTHGHALGDQVLAELATLMQRRTRAGDLPARWGGEEFVWLLPGAGEETAGRAAERLRVAVAGHPFVCGRLTISLGIATLRPGEDARSLFARADAALYQAKQSGRNRGCLAADDPGGAGSSA